MATDCAHAFSIPSYSTVYFWEHLRIDACEDGCDSAPPPLAVPARPIELGTRSRVRFSRNLSDRFEPPSSRRGSPCLLVLRHDYAAAGCYARAFAASTAVHNAPFRPEAVVRPVRRDDCHRDGCDLLLAARSGLRRLLQSASRPDGRGAGSTGTSDLGRGRAPRLVASPATGRATDDELSVVHDPDRGRQRPDTMLTGCRLGASQPMRPGASPS